MKPYLLSVGVGLPFFGVWTHRYYPVKKKRALRSISVLGCHVVWTTYLRSEGP